MKMGLEVSNRTQNIEERSMSNSRLKGIVLDYINKVDSYEGRTLELETMLLLAEAHSIAHSEFSHKEEK